MNSQKTNQEIIDSTITYLKDKYDPEIIFVYGSRARGNPDPESDVDVMCFSNKPSQKKEARILDGVFLDSWIYDLAELDPDKENFFCILDGYCALDSEGRGLDFFAKVRAKFAGGPVKSSDEDSEHSILWVRKMLSRVSRGDIEGNYRRQWLLVDLLPIYFQLRSKWYLGSKKSLAWLKENDKTGFDLFDLSLKDSSNLESLSQLAEYVISC